MLLGVHTLNCEMGDIGSVPSYIPPRTSSSIGGGSAIIRLTILADNLFVTKIMSQSPEEVRKSLHKG